MHLTNSLVYFPGPERAVRSIMSSAAAKWHITWTGQISAGPAHFLLLGDNVCNSVTGVRKRPATVSVRISLLSVQSLGQEPHGLSSSPHGWPYHPHTVLTPPSSSCPWCHVWTERLSFGCISRSFNAKSSGTNKSELKCVQGQLLTLKLHSWTSYPAKSR